MTRWARAALAAGVAGVCLLTVGCTSGGAAEKPRPPVMDLLERKQETYDQLPPGSPALLVTVPGSSRSMGGTGLYEFFIARGLSAPYCVVAVDIYHVQAGQACGGELFGGELVEGMRFEFGAYFARAIPRATWETGLNPYFSFAFEPVATEWSDEFELIMAREQIPPDIPPGAADGGRWYDIDSFRLFAVDGDTAFHVSYGSRPGAGVCMVTHTDAGDSSAWGSGGCGVQDVVLNAAHSHGGTFVGLKSHFSAAGFEGETPEGWRQVSPLLRVQGPGGD